MVQAQTDHTQTVFVIRDPHAIFQSEVLFSTKTSYNKFRKLTKSSIEKGIAHLTLKVGLRVLLCTYCNIENLVVCVQMG